MAGKGQGTDKRLTFTAALENMERMSAGGTWLEGGRQEKAILHWSAGGLWLEALCGGWQDRALRRVKLGVHLDGPDMVVFFYVI